MRDQSESDDFSNVYDMRASQGAMFMLRAYDQGLKCNTPEYGKVNATSHCQMMYLRVEGLASLSGGTSELAMGAVL